MDYKNFSEMALERVLFAFIINFNLAPEKEINERTIKRNRQNKAAPSAETRLIRR